MRLQSSVRERMQCVVAINHRRFERPHESLLFLLEARSSPQPGNFSEKKKYCVVRRSVNDIFGSKHLRHSINCWIELLNFSRHLKIKVLYLHEESSTSMELFHCTKIFKMFFTLRKKFFLWNHVVYSLFEHLLVQEKSVIHKVFVLIWHTCEPEWVFSSLERYVRIRNFYNR